MADDIDRDAPPERSMEPPPPPPRRRKRWGLRLFTILVLVPAIAIAFWIVIALNFSYSKGDRVGYLQKFSKKGWICKTWEGDLAMVSIPGTTPEIFHFTVRNEDVALELERLLGERVDVTYEEHRGVPTRCFGETNHFVVGARAAGGIPTPPPPAAAQPAGQPTTTPAPQPGASPPQPPPR